MTLLLLRGFLQCPRAGAAPLCAAAAPQVLLASRTALWLSLGASLAAVGGCSVPLCWWQAGAHSMPPSSRTLEGLDGHFVLSAVTLSRGQRGEQKG